MSTSHLHLSIGSKNITLVEHWFWNEFVNGWELDTYRVFEKFINPSTCFVDIGAWIGPTVLFAHMLGAKRIFAVEANPPSFNHLVQNINLNPELQKIVHATNVCISDERKTVSFGSEKATSAASIKDSVFTVPAYPLQDYLEMHSISDIGLIKIDIEGSEHFLGKDLEHVAKEHGCPVYLSLHPPLYTDKAPLREFIEKLDKSYNFFDPEETAITSDRLLEMVLSNEPSPSWGTQYGNFFEVLLKVR